MRKAASSTSDLITWLRQQLEADEAEADAILSPPPGYYDKGWQADKLREFAMRQLAEVEAKRRILAEHAPDDADLDRKYCTRCGDWPTVEWPCPTVRLLARRTPGEHGWQEEWRV